MWSAFIDIKNQRFVIEDREGNVVAVKDMPTNISPNPGRNALMGFKENSDAWGNIFNLVEAANRGRLLRDRFPCYQGRKCNE